MIAVDTNILVCAHRADAPFHAVARPVLEAVSRGPMWAIPWPCLHEFLAVVTNPRIYRPATPIERAFAQLRALTDLPNLTLLAEGEGYLSRLESLAVPARTGGGAIHDARIAALCISHGVTELWTADRDFSRFAALRTRNPLIA